MSKYKAGLHKDVSAIFDGVSLPKSDTAQRSSADPAPGHQGSIDPKPSVPAQQLPVLQPPVQKPSVVQSPTQKPPVSQPPAQKPSASEPQTQKLPVLQPPVRKPSASQSPTQKSSASQPPNQKPLVSEPSASKSPVSEPSAQKPPAASNTTAAKPKTQPPSQQSQPKETPAKQPKADAAAKTAGQAQWQQKLEQIKGKLFATKPGVNPIKQKAMVIAMPILFIILIFVFIQVFSAPSRKITGPVKAGQAKTATTGSDSKAKWQAPSLYPATLRDPMQFGPATGGQGGGSELIVKGIVYSESNPTAVIGDQVVHQGDKILDVVVTKINEDSVEFEANSKKWIQNVQR